jgi:hypothetical protein
MTDEGEAKDRIPEGQGFYAPREPAGGEIPVDRVHIDLDRLAHEPRSVNFDVASQEAVQAALDEDRKSLGEQYVTIRPDLGPLRRQLALSELRTAALTLGPALGDDIMADLQALIERYETE